MTVRHLLPIVLVGEAPPRGGLGPLGPFDCDSGLRLARLDPANVHVFDEYGVGAMVVSTVRCEVVGRTLGLFNRVNLLAEHPGRGAGKGDAWPKEQAAEAWRALAPSLAGRRVALAGRAAEGAGLKGLPPLRWLRLGGEGEPAEVCALPHPSGVNRWYNDGANRAAVGAWLADVRREREDADGAWTAIGGGWAYHYARGCWGTTDGGRFARLYADYSVNTPSSWDLIRDRLLESAAALRRGGGAWALSILDHCVLVANLCAHPGSKRLALAHDLHEPLVCDMPSPLKRVVRREWRPVEEVAARAVERLLGLDPTPEEREEVRRADRLALLVEARQVGVDLGDPDADGTCRAAFARLHARPYSRADWLAAWDAAAR